uniref:Ubiquitin-like domain-containing protein n=1 Tax=Ditylenchus dipsaci TaxID=166011 RepID=A0A915E1J6_9BILA
MKVTVKFNNRREQFDGLETKTFGQFRNDVYSRFGIDSSSSLSFKLGNNVVDLEPSQNLSEFGVVSGDILYLAPSQPNAVVENMDIGSNSAGSSVSTSTSVFVLFEKHGYENTSRIRLPEEDSMFFLLEYRHRCASTKLQISINMFRDDSDSTRVTSLHVTGMLVTTFGDRHLQESMLLARNAADTEAELTTMLMNSLLFPVKDRMLGPDNAFLRFISQGYLAEKFFRYLTAKDLVHIEETCKYAKWRCRTSKLIDETIWKPLLGNTAPQKLDYPLTYREIYQKKVMDQRQLSEEARRVFAYRLPFNPHFFIHDDNGFMRQPFRQPEPFRPIPSPLDPFSGGLLLPQRPGRQQGQPRVYPLRPIWDDPNQTNQPPDPDMPQGPQRNPFGQGLSHPGFGEPDIQQPGFGFPRRGGSRGGGSSNFPRWM